MGKYKEKDFKVNTRVFKDRVQRLMFDTPNISRESRELLNTTLAALDMNTEFPKKANAQAMESIDGRISDLLDKVNADVQSLQIAKISGGATGAALLVKHSEMLLQAVVGFRPYGTKVLSDADTRDQDSLAEITAEIEDKYAEMSKLDTDMDALVAKAAKCEGPTAVAERNKYKSSWNTLKSKRGTLERSVKLLSDRKTALDSAVSIAGLAITSESVKQYTLDVKALTAKAAQVQKDTDRLNAENESVMSLAAELNDALGTGDGLDDGVFDALVDERQASNFSSSVDAAGESGVDEFDSLVNKNTD